MQHVGQNYWYLLSFPISNIKIMFQEPLQSRCAIVKYSRLPDEQLVKRMLYIIERENVDYNKDGLNAILYTAQGDMRQVNSFVIETKCQTLYF
jgi:DNA polymerase III delta prime subunit